jgi:glycosyltransferase involved in cell wall biosynthesis
MKFSIVLPVRNGGAYARQCVQSILSQTYSHFQFHVLDNCSTDGTLQWLQSIGDDRIILYPSTKALSIEENWARIITIPKNEFITLIGHDDLLDPHYLATMDALILQHPSASLYQSHFRYIDPQGRLIRHCKPMDGVQSATEFLGFFLSGMIDTMGTGFMMRSADYDRIGGIPPYPNLLFADFELWIELTRNSYKATASRECFAFRLHQSMTTNSSDISYHRAFEKFVAYLRRIKEEDPALSSTVERYGLAFIEFYCKGLSHRLLRTPRPKRDGLTVSAFLADCKRYADELVPGNQFIPQSRYSIGLAKRIDSNFFTRSLFLFFKKIRPEPILK